LGTLADVTYRLPASSEEAKECEKLLELLTPICKGFMTDMGFESSNHGMQVLGGHGYIREHGMEQLARDGRILQQYEGANGIQSLDLLGRKVLANGGATLRLFTNQIDAFCAQHEGNAELKDMVSELRRHSTEWHELVGEILQRAIKNPDEAGAASYDFMSYSDYVVFAFMFARMALVAQQKLAAGAADADFYRAKQFTARFYFLRMLPRTRALVVSMASGSDNVMGIDEKFLAF
jgi:Acetyl-CoA dehydrogenase C-terminal like/Acyl-CoA dehydrogenase, C-terminal domain